jgi:hypothetical protein
MGNQKMWTGIKMEERQDMGRSDKYECWQLNNGENNNLVLKFHEIRRAMKKIVHTTAAMSYQ